MKPYVRIIIFFIIMISGMVLIEFAARDMYVPDSDLYFQHEDFMKKMSNIKIVFLGSSHAARGINPGHITGSSYNLAYPSQDLYYDYMVIKKYIDKMPKLKCVIINLSYFSFYYDESEDAPFLLKDYYHELGIGPRKISLSFIKNLSVFFIHQDTFLKDLMSRKKRKLLWMEGTGEIDTVMENDVVLNNGSRLSRGTMDRVSLERDGKSRAQYHGSFNNVAVLKDNVQITKKLLNLLTGRDIKVIMITTPYTDFYRNNFDKNHRREFYAIIDGVCGKNLRCRYVDLNNSHDFIYDDFLNSDHLNFKGAEKLSRKINDMLCEK